MRVTEVTVSAGRTFNHPYEQYSNLKPNITLKATLTEEEDVGEAVKKLQAHAEALIEDHKQAMLKSLDELEQMTRAEQEMSDLGERLVKAQARMEELRRKYPSLLPEPKKEETDA